VTTNLGQKVNKALALASTLPYRIRSAPRDLRYHFIHIPKNGGTSVRWALKWRGDVSMSEPRHYRYVDVVDSVGKHLQFFSVIRNPWSRTASRYNFARKQSLKWPEHDERRQYIRNATFEQFVRERRIIDIPAHPGQPWMGPLNSWYNQLEWIRDSDGQVRCDCLRLENLGSDVRRYFDPWIVLPEKKAPARKYDYRDMYTDELIGIVADVFKEDIDYFGFDFDSPARRNVMYC